jgi:alcohol dehydrogenase class IV
MMGAIAFQKGLGACHSLAHPLSSEHGLHHGLANALCLLSVIAFNASAVPERVRRVGALLGDEHDCAQAVAALRARVGINGGLAGSGIREEHLPPLGKKALEDACHRSNPGPAPRQICSSSTVRHSEGVASQAFAFPRTTTRRLPTG